MGKIITNMNKLLGMYMGVGRSVQASMAKRSPFLLDGAQPVIGQTPGRLQYYRAENEPFLPDEVKWKLKLPTAFAMRQQNFRYEDQINDEITNFLSK